VVAPELAHKCPEEKALPPRKPVQHMLEWLEYLGNIVVVGFLLLLIVIAWVVYPLWSTCRGFRDLRPMRSWTFSLRSLVAVVVASAFLSWFLGWQADELALLNWKQPSTWLLVTPPALVVLSYVALIWHLVRSAMSAETAARRTGVAAGLAGSPRACCCGGCHAARRNRRIDRSPTHKAPLVETPPLWRIPGVALG
jgi:hypothetical protein